MPEELAERIDENAEDGFLSALATRILTEIRKGTYTCMVCTGDIDSDSSIWSCPHCYRVFDLDCIRDWAKRGSSTQADRSWRCPSCNETIKRLPKNYTCWCGKVINPPANTLTPHSCGQTCGAPLKKCVHKCPIECHPGPHASKCGAMGPVMKCHCGKEKRQAPCELTPYGRGWSCNQVCGDLLPCGIHRCKRKCHSGLCGECSETLAHAKCFCGKTSTDDLLCRDREPIVSDDGDGNRWIGSFQCENVCGVPLDCGNHTCEQHCHSITPHCHQCPRSPAVLTHCACGKTKVEPGSRTSCLDPIPTCDQVCGKRLPCGHTCYWKCHDGPCAPCYRAVEMDCRCGHSQLLVACALAQQGFQPRCHHKCMAHMNCRRHLCGRICCDHEQVALARDRERARAIRLHVLDPNSIDNSGIEAVHICTKECGRILACGKHRCKAPCHSGKCPACLESSSEDLVCSCGMTVIPAPVRCGTKLPPCPYPCQRPKSCGHIPEPHHCHPDTIPCPPCTVLVTRPCQCSKKNLVKNVLCSQKIVSCGKLCGEMLGCGEHKCQKVCHKPGECQVKCTQPCGKLLDCGHKCPRKCHAPKACTGPCRAEVIVSCECGRRHTKVICCEHTPGQKLECDDECLREQRNRALFSAFSLDSPRGNSLISPELLAKRLIVENSYSDFVLKLYAKQAVWCSSIENIFVELVTGKLNRVSHHFNPMRSVQRQFIHELAETYGLFSESQDREPKRSVFIQVTKDTQRPQLSLKEASTVIRQVKRGEEQRLERQNLTNALKEQKDTEPYNAIIIKDVFFGVTRDKLEEAVEDLWQGMQEVTGGTVKLIPDNNFVFCGDKVAERTKLQEIELRALCGVFEKRLKELNMAMTVELAKVDKDVTVVYATSKPKLVTSEDREESEPPEEQTDEPSPESPNTSTEEASEDKSAEKESYDWY